MPQKIVSAGAQRKRGNRKYRAQSSRHRRADSPLIVKKIRNPRVAF